jgi:hypothetical protein
MLVCTEEKRTEHREESRKGQSRKGAASQRLSLIESGKKKRQASSSVHIPSS